METTIWNSNKNVNRNVIALKNLFNADRCHVSASIRNINLEWYLFVLHIGGEKVCISNFAIRLDWLVRIQNVNIAYLPEFVEREDTCGHTYQKEKIHPFFSGHKRDLPFMFVCLSTYNVCGFNLIIAHFPTICVYYSCVSVTVWILRMAFKIFINLVKFYLNQFL